MPAKRTEIQGPHIRSHPQRRPILEIVSSNRPLLFKVRLVFDYMVQVKWFDITKGVNTSTLKHNNYSSFGSSATEVPYMPSFSGPVKAAHRFLLSNNPASLSRSSFIDVGCGAGKVLIYWALLNRRARIQQSISGVDISSKLIRAAEFNTEKLSIQAKLFTGDILGDINVQKHFGSKSLTVFIYNPFGEGSLRKMLKRLETNNPLTLIYVNPQHEKILCPLGFRQIYSKTAWHPSRTVSIYLRENRKNSLKS